MKFHCFLVISMLAAACGTASAKVDTLLPKPKRITMGADSLKLPTAVSLSDPTGCQLLADFIASQGMEVATEASVKIDVQMIDSIPGAYDYELKGFGNEAYALDITPRGITIAAVEPLGVIRATQTLAQIAEGENGALPSLSIVDWPAFKLRGYMHDVGRSHIDIPTLKKQIDLLSKFKVNAFHWHLTENQAWRFESKAFPQLTSAESMTRFPGKYYTQEECRELEQYARERGVVVIPEIDMPGHSAAYERAMGHSMQTPEGVEELKIILGEVAEVFPLAPYIHIGADEKRITYPDFLKIMTDRVHELGKLAAVWNPILGVKIGPEAGFDLLTNWSTAGRLVPGIPNVDLRYNYINHFDVFADLVGIYKSNIMYVPQGNSDVAGAITGIWNDRALPTEEDIVMQNNFYANALATAERAWMGGGKQYIEAGGVMLPGEGEEWEEFVSWEARFLHHKDHALASEPIPYVKQTHVKWNIVVESDSAVTEHNATGAGIYLRHTWGETVPALVKGAKCGDRAYATTYVYSPVAQEAGALIELQNYSRSEKDAAPDLGQWDRKGSRIWLNGEEILPPAWANAGVEISNEVNLGNENFTARAPVPIDLKKGWNEVRIYLPYEPAPGVRLNKWMFTFVITDPSGRYALPLRYEGSLPPTPY